jgi:hypothetical protein
MLPKKSRLKSAIPAMITVIVLIGIAGFILLNRQNIIDTINYLEYKPSSLIASFAERSTMSSEGKFLFYSAKPSLEGKTAFNISCPSSSSQVAILGCYDGQDIHIYNVQDTQLDGIRDVTAAYEMLHAAYKRLSPNDRAEVNTLVEAEFKSQGNAAMRQIVSYFATSEPGQRDNELFSLIATQVPTINPQLESIYSRYFTNRQALVALYNKYSSVFTNLMNQETTLADQLTNLNSTIKSESTQYDTEVSSLNTDINTFNANAKNGNFSSQSDFNTQKNALTVREDALDTEQTKINGDISTYNTELAQYNTITTNSAQLFNSINSLSTAPSS